MKRRLLIWSLAILTLVFGVSLRTAPAAEPGHRQHRRGVLLLLVVIALILPGVPALAVNEHLCASALPSSFIDVDPSSPFSAFIDCLVSYEITSGTGPTTYSPAAPVERWQMAIFLQNLWEVNDVVLSGSPQGFTDIGSLSAETQTAINKAAQLGITSGVAPGLYGPYDHVSRWQMAIFLARFARATRLPLPAPAPTGFTDIGGLSMEAQDAISVVRSLGITTGTSPTTYSPGDAVTREQMAAFLVRTLQATWSLGVRMFTLACSTDSQGVETCTGLGEYPANVPLRFDHGWYVLLSEDTSGFEGTSAEFYVDGVIQPATLIDITLPGISFRGWQVLIPGGLSGSHQLEARLIDNGVLRFVESAFVTFFS